MKMSVDQKKRTQKTKITGDDGLVLCIRGRSKMVEADRICRERFPKCRPERHESGFYCYVSFGYCFQVANVKLR